MGKRLLIALNDSPAASDLLAEAVAMAREDGWELRLMHVIDETSIPWGERDTARRSRALNALADRGSSILADARARIREAGLDAGCASPVRARRTQRVGDMIAEEAETWGADLVLIGERRRGPLRRVLGRGVASALAQRSSVPVLPIEAQRAGCGISSGGLAGTWAGDRTPLPRRISAQEVRL